MNRKKILLPLLLIVIVVFSVVLNNFYMEKEVSKETPIEAEKENQTQVMSDESMKTLPFEKEIQVIRIREENNSALKDTPRSGIATTKATPGEKENSLEIYNNAPEPNEKTELIVIYEAYSADDLIFSEMYLSDKKDFAYTISPVENKYVNNNGRLYLNSSFELEVEDKVKLFLLDGQRNLVPSKNVVVIKENNGKVSQLTFENLGKINSKNMRYQRIKGAYIVNDSELTGDSLEDAKKNLGNNMKAIENSLKEEE